MFTIEYILSLLLSLPRIPDLLRAALDVAGTLRSESTSFPYATISCLRECALANQDSVKSTKTSLGPKSLPLSVLELRTEASTSVCLYLLARVDLAQVAHCGKIPLSFTGIRMQVSVCKSRLWRRLPGVARHKLVDNRQQRPRHRSRRRLRRAVTDRIACWG